MNGITSAWTESQALTFDEWQPGKQNMKNRVAGVRGGGQAVPGCPEETSAATSTGSGHHATAP